jgi:Phage portal protein, SPP1 Gp6-like
VSDLTVAIAAMDRTRPAYDKANAYYVGAVDERFGNRRMRNVLRNAQEYFRLNLAKTPVNAVANRLEIATVTVPGSDILTSILQTEVWDENELLFEIPGLIRAACKYGDAYLLVWEGTEDGTVEVSYNSPLEGRMTYDPENSRRKLYYTHVWAEDKVRYADVFYADRVEQWYQSTDQKPGDEGAWEQRVTSTREPTPEELADMELDPAVDEVPGIDQWPLPNPYGEIPAFHFRTDRPWGVPLHKDAYGPQDGITKEIATMMGTVDFQGFPQRYALEEAGTDTDDMDDEDWDEGDNTSTTASGIPAPGLRSGSGEVWWLKGVKGVGQFDVADPDVFLKPATFFMRMMAQTTDTPLHMFDPGGDQPSGESRRAAEADLVNKVRTLGQAFAAALSAALAFALKVLAHGDVKVDVRWKNPESVDDSDSWATAEVKIRTGVPVKVVLMEQGYTEDQAEQWTNSNDDQDLVRKVALLNGIGEAVQKLGAGVGFGVVTAEQVAQVISAVLEPEGADSGGQ